MVMRCEQQELPRMAGGDANWCHYTGQRKPGQVPPFTPGAHLRPVHWIQVSPDRGHNSLPTSLVPHVCSLGPYFSITSSHVSLSHYVSPKLRHQILILYLGFFTHLDAQASAWEACFIAFVWGTPCFSTVCSHKNHYNPTFCSSSEPPFPP